MRHSITNERQRLHYVKMSGKLVRFSSKTQIFRSVKHGLQQARASGNGTYLKPAH